MYTDKVRAEVIGILANELMRVNNFDARICLTPFTALRKPFTTTETIQGGSDEAQLIHPYLWPVECPRHVYEAPYEDESAAMG